MTLPIGASVVVTTMATNTVVLTSSNAGILSPASQQGSAPNPTFTLTVAGYGTVQLSASQGGATAMASVDVYGALVLVSPPGIIAGVPGTTTFSVNQPGPASGSIALSIACAAGANGSVTPTSVATGSTQPVTVTITTLARGSVTHTCTVTATAVGGATLVIPIDAYATPVTIN